MTEQKIEGIERILTDEDYQRAIDREKAIVLVTLEGCADCKEYMENAGSFFQRLSLDGIPVFESMLDKKKPAKNYLPRGLKIDYGRYLKDIGSDQLGLAVFPTTVFYRDGKILDRFTYKEGNDESFVRGRVRENFWVLVD